MLTGKFFSIIFFIFCFSFLILGGTSKDVERDETIKQLKDSLGKLQQRVALLEQESLKVTISARGRREVSTFVSFSTSLSKEVTGMQIRQTIKFDRVIENTGNAYIFYNRANGIFVAPVSGIYVFTWSISTKNERIQSSELVKERTVYGFAKADSGVISGSTADYSTATNIVVLKVGKGEHVYVRIGDGDGILDGHNYDTFSGWIINETD